MKKIKLSLFFLAFFQVTVYAQLDPLYNQYLFNQSMINPAYTGINNVLNITAISRGQWIGIKGAPTTHSLNASSSFLDNKLGAGLLIVSDNVGASNIIEVQGLYSYRINMTNDRSLSFGLMTGYLKHRYDFGKLNQQPNTQDQALQADDDFSKTNFGAGIFYKAKNYFLGVSIPRILNSDITTKDKSGKELNSSRYRKHFYVSAGYLFDQFLALKFKPSILLKIVDGQPSSIDFNASLLLKEALWVGATVRNFNVIGLNGQFEVSDQLRLGYAFELPLNNIRSNTVGTHELMVSFDLEVFSGHAIGRRYF